MEYRARILRLGKSAKNKGIILGRWAWDAEFNPKAEGFVFEAANNEDAYIYLTSKFRPQDRRPLSCKSYLRKAALKPRKVGQKVRLMKPYAAVVGVFEGYREGVVTEIVSDKVVSLWFEGYRTQFVDFHLAELV